MTDKFERDLIAAPTGPHRVMHMHLILAGHRAMNEDNQKENLLPLFLILITLVLVLSKLMESVLCCAPFSGVRNQLKFIVLF